MKVMIFIISISTFAFGQVTHIIEVSNFVFNPQNITIPLGDIVEWRWIEGAHTTTSDSTSGANSWDVALTSGNQSFSIVLTITGVHNYHCTPHQFMGMVGSITVTDPLPVEITLFTAGYLNKNILLKWNTATETNNFGFEIQRMAFKDESFNQDWNKIGFVSGAGNSNKYNFYSYTDNDIESMVVYKYRLKQIDTDGSFNYSKTVSVENNILQEFSLDQNYPNPFNPNTIIDFSIPVDGFVSIKLYNVLGKEVETLLHEFKNAGRHHIMLNSNSIKGGLNSGIYYYSLSSGNFSSTRKMIILK